MYIKNKKMNKTRSETVCYHPFAAALIAALKELGEGFVWRPNSLEKRLFMEGSFVIGAKDLHDLPEIESRVSYDFDLLNRFLWEKGFSIKLENPHDPKSFGVVSIMKILEDWIESGTEGEICVEGKTYPAVHLKGKNVTFYKSEWHKNPVVSIKTKSGDEVLLSVADSFLSTDTLTGHIDRIFGSLDVCRDFSGLVFPMVDLEEEVDISWLKGLPAFLGDDEVAFISQALQQTKFKMDQIGAIVESAVAIGIAKTSISKPRPDLVIDKPFFVTVRRKGFNLPIFSGYIAQDCWKKPVR